MSPTLLLLLLCLPIAAWGAALTYTMRPDWVWKLIPAFHLFAPVYAIAAAIATARRGWRAARELLFIVLLVIGANCALAWIG